MSVRYAVYLAPAPESALWRFGARVLGRDAATGEGVEGFAPDGYSAEAWREIAADPRRYGFHATLKAPFRLREGRTLGELEAGVAALAASCAAFDLGPLRVSTIGFSGGAGFVALTPADRSPRLTELENRAVRELDGFRAPLTETEIQRRRPDRLTERQRSYLSAWGYPYVLDDFRLHFTLSGAVEAPEALAEALGRALEREVGASGFTVDALALFAQGEDGDFVVRRRFALGGPRSSV